MTVHELIEALGKYPPHTKVVLSKDPEGNDYYDGFDLSSGYWDGESFLNEDDADKGYDDPVVCIWP